MPVPATDDVYRARLAETAASLSPAALKVARFIDGNRTLVVASSASRLAATIGTSDATVVRSVQALGFRGLTEVREMFARSMDERPTPAADMRATLAEAGEGVAEIIGQVFSIHAEASAALREADSLSRLSSAVGLLAPARRIVVFGVGPSCFMAGYMAFMLRRTGRRSEVLDVTGRALADRLLGLEAGDAVFMLSYGKPYAEATALVAECRRLGLPFVLTTDACSGALAREADVVILAPRGRTSRVALHAPTMLVVEAVIMGLVSVDRLRALRALDHLEELRSLAQPRPNGCRPGSGGLGVQAAEFAAGRRAPSPPTDRS